MMLCRSCFACEESTCQAILRYIQKELPHCGELKTSAGFVYVDIDDSYIHALVKFIQKDGFKEPPYFGRSDSVGAHITAIYPDELKKMEIVDISECGEIIEFLPLHCQIVHPNKMQNIEEVYFVVVEAPQLDQIRVKYGLPEREYDFHITIGMKPAAVN